MQKLSEILESWRSRNVDYYARAFDKLEKTGENTFNNAAAYFGCAWMLYRKMYLYAGIAFICQFVLARVLRFLGHEITCFGYADIGESVGVAISALISIRLFGTCGSKLYYKVIKSRISKNYHTLDNYRTTAVSLALCFVFERALPDVWGVPLMICMILYFYYADFSQNTTGGARERHDEQVSIIKQYLNRNASPISLVNKIPIYLAYILAALSCAYVLYYFPTNKWERIALSLSILFPSIR